MDKLVRHTEAGAQEKSIEWEDVATEAVLTAEGQGGDIGSLMPWWRKRVKDFMGRSAGIGQKTKKSGASASMPTTEFVPPNKRDPNAEW